MKVIADVDKCEGYANCIIAAPDVFALDDDFMVRLLVEQPSEDRRQAVEEAVRSCPTSALSIEQ